MFWSAGQMLDFIRRLDVGVGGGHLEPRLVCYVIGLDGEGSSRHSKGTAGVWLGQCACGVDGDVELWADPNKE